MEKDALSSKCQKKSFALLALTFVSWAGASLWSWNRYSHTIPECGSVVSLFLKLLHAMWMLLWLWGIHNFWHQTLSFLSRRRGDIAPPSDVAPSKEDQSVAVLYATCDDFDSEACESCLNQSHPGSRLIICDDSRDERLRRQIDEWASRHTDRVIVVRRCDHGGFKAGNLNHAISQFVSEEFIVLCDADEILPRDFVARMLSRFSHSRTAFAQARHEARSPARTRFASLLAPTIDIFYKHCLPLRNRFGFVSCFGHGVMIRRSVWSAIGGFPEIVSEDIGFASRALAAGYRGVYVEEVVAQEAYPSTYTAFRKRYCKVISGTIEYFRKEFPVLLKSPHATLTEKVDLLVTFSCCYLGATTMISLLGGLLLLYIYRLQGYDRLETWLLGLYLAGPLTPVVPLLINLFRRPQKHFHYMFVGALAYASLLPLLCLEAIEQTAKLREPVFEATGKMARQKQRARDHLLIQVFGLLILALALFFHSAAFIPAIGVSLMYILGPLMCFTERKDWIGFLARNCCFIPFTVIALLLLWFRMK